MCDLVTRYTASTKIRTRTFELKKGDVMDPCLEDLGSRYVGTRYARMQLYPKYGCVHADIDAVRCIDAADIRWNGAAADPGSSVFQY